MKIREIILDFTSLLDIIMIILFFFILFTNMDTETAMTRAEQKETEYSTLIEEVSREQSDWKKKTEKEWSRIESADENAGANQKALLDFDNGAVLSINITDINTGDDFKLSITGNNKKLIGFAWAGTDDFRERLLSVLKKLDIDSGKVIISTLTYDGYSLGTEKAVPQVENVVRKLQEQYKNLYFTTINVTR